MSKIPLPAIPRPILKCLLIMVCLVPIADSAASLPPSDYIAHGPAADRFPLVDGAQAAAILVDQDDHAGVRRVAGHLQSDIERVTSIRPDLLSGETVDSPAAVIVGTVGRSSLIDRLIAEGKLDTTGLEGAWESFVIERIESPWDGLEQALVIAGSDKRGTIYGMYDLAEEIGVSPWYWWADVPAEQHDQLHVLPGRHASGEPKVRYRGIFLNDEAPALSGWAHHTFGGFNADFYDKVFELILRLRGNYLWPAMWGRSLYDDDPQSDDLAHEYGVVLGTSHHEPLMRAHVEWSRYGEGAWDYSRNEDVLRTFWREGVERMGDKESIITIGMRGDGDEAMSEETNIELLERIVRDQREIIEDVTGKDASDVPQIWALYKEVQAYYDQGMRVPDDVTLLLCDDNWGNIRRLPDPDAPEHPGGYGIYYHFDYVGGPRNYKWINVTQIERVWEQMHLAWQHDVEEIWIVNVGDLKPMELPISFFLDYAWDPEAIPLEQLDEYTTEWAAEQFPAEHAEEIASLLDGYTKFNSRRTPEMLSPETYSLTDYREFERVVGEYNALARRAEAVMNELPSAYRDAFDQLVLYPVQASANLNDLYLTVAKNRRYAEQGRSATNALADRAVSLFERDAALARRYNRQIAGGKWQHMMDQTNIGYTYWQQPEKDIMPEVRRISLADDNAVGVSIEGDDGFWLAGQTTAELPPMTPFGDERRWFEVFARGTAPLDIEVSGGTGWLKIQHDPSSDDTQARYWVSVDWDNADPGTWRVPIKVETPSGEITVFAMVRSPGDRSWGMVDGFVETNGVVSIEAERFDRATEADGAGWRVLPNLGRTGSSVTVFPVTAERRTPGTNAPHLEYKIHTFSSGHVDVHTYVAPTLDYYGTGGLHYAVSIDDGPVRTVNMHADTSGQAWNEQVGSNINVGVTSHRIDQPGAHTVKVWVIDPGVVLQKIVVDMGGMKPSYLGPPESPRVDGGEITRRRTPQLDASTLTSEQGGPIVVTPAAAGSTSEPSVAYFDSFEYTGNDAVYDKHPAGEGEFNNPILAGFYPDPSICRVGDDFYLVNSTFAFYPGIPVFHSKDLVNWTQVGNVIDRPGMLDFTNLRISRGIFAPAISYHDGLFYLVTTCVDCAGNIVFTAEDPAGPWSDPVYLGEVQGIDPSIFFDDDGRAYIINNGAPIGEPRYDGHRALWLQEFDYESLETIGPRKLIVDGGADPSTNPIWIEGPHIYNIDGTYYLICAEGGTSTWHSQVVFRSDSVWGPWEPFEGNPILTQRHLDDRRPDPITSAGHADIVQLLSGEWWAVFLATRPYQGNMYNTGRETYLMPVEWEDGWPIITRGDDLIPYRLERPGAPRQDDPPLPLSGNFTHAEDFTTGERPPHWLFIRVPRTEWYDINTDEGSLAITARPEPIGAGGQPSFIGRRQQHMTASVTTRVRFEPTQDSDRAGLVAYQNDSHFYFFGVVQQGANTAIQLRRRAGSGDPVEGVILASADLPGGASDGIELKIDARGAQYDFLYRSDDGAWIPLETGADGTILSTQRAGGFVGAVIGMYACSGGRP